MPKTQTTPKPNDRHEPLTVIQCRQRKSDGFPLDNEKIILQILAATDNAECQKICDAWENGEPYAIEVAGKPHVGIIKGDVVLREHGPRRWVVLFTLHEEPGLWQPLLKS